MGSNITYTDKENFKLEAGIPTNKKVSKDDMNEIKTVVNANNAVKLEAVSHDGTLGGLGTTLSPLTVLGVTPTGYENLITGVIWGGIITINADPTKWDLSAGQGIVMDWTDPTTPVRTVVSWDEALAQTIPDINENITIVSMDKTGALVVASGPLPTPAAGKIRIQFQVLIHTSHTQIDRVTEGNRPAYQVTEALLDYVAQLGPINSGNFVEANAADLVVKRESGTTTLPFINRQTDHQDPTNKVNPVEAPVAAFIQSYQDGVGGFTSVPVGVVDPDTYDDGSGVLQTVANNQWTIKRFYFFGQTNVLYLTEGQVTYASLQLAEAAIFSENPILTPITDLGTFVTALIVKKGTTDLSDTATAKFIDINISGSASSVGTTVVSWGNILGTITDQTDLIAEFDKLGLEQLDEGNGIGWRLKGKDPANYGDIGLHATDESESSGASSTKGATGIGSHAEGLDTIASGNGAHAEGQLTEAKGDSSHASGGGTRAINLGSHAIGVWNVGMSVDSVFEVGIGDNDGARKNGLEVNKDGGVLARELTKTIIKTLGDPALITKEYLNRADQDATTQAALTGSISFDMTKSVQKGTLTGNVTLVAFTNEPSATDDVSAVLNIYQNGTGGYTIDWVGSGVKIEIDKTAADFQPNGTANSHTQFWLNWDGSYWVMTMIKINPTAL